MSVGWKKFDFFDAYACHFGQDEILRGIKFDDNLYLSAVEKACEREGDGGSTVGRNFAEKSKIDVRGDAVDGMDARFWIGLSNGMVHEMVVSSLLPSSDSHHDHHHHHQEPAFECRVARSFPAVDGMHVAYIGNVNVENSKTRILVVVGYTKEDGRTSTQSCIGSDMVVTCWDISDKGSLEVIPKRISTGRVFKSLKLPEASVCSVDVDCCQWPKVMIAVGPSGGGLYVYSCSDMVKSRVFASLPFGHVQMKIALGGAHAVSHVYFARHDRTLYVYGVSEKGVIGIEALTGRVLVEDNVGSLAMCSAVTRNGELAICDDDGVFFYTIKDGRTVAASIKGEKKLMKSCGYITAIVSPSHQEDAPFDELKFAHIERKVLAGSLSLLSPVSVLYSDATPSGCLRIFAMDGRGSVYYIIEKSIEKQVNELCDNRLFPQALHLCSRAPGDAQHALEAEVNRRYGDYLFEKRDFESATDAYVRTIGIVETSYPIQKLLNAQQIAHVSTYLKALFDQEMAYGDHISLLIQSYVKMNARKEIDAFVRDLCLRHAEYSFDTDAAIDVLRQTGFTQHALDIAEAYAKDQTYVSILLSERAAYKETLEYLRSKPRAHAARELATYGKVLLQNEPVETTGLLMELCISPSLNPSITPGDDFVADLADFAHLYADNPQDLRYACETILAMGTPNLPSQKSLYHILLDVHLMNTYNGASSKTSVGHPGAKGKSCGDQEAALELLKRGWTPGHEPLYDADTALTSCRVHSFSEGIIFINLMMRRYREAIAVMADIHDWEAILEVCQKHGDAIQGGDPMVWHEALTRLSSPHAGPGSEETLRTLLGIIEENNIMAPLTVLDILARNPHLKLGLVKEYFSSLLESEYEMIKDYSREIEKINRNIEVQKQTLEKLQNKPAIFQSTKDSQTGSSLELPLVHFMCGHSYNLRTLSEHDNPTCPLCSEEHDRIKAMSKSFRSASKDKDAFFRQLQASDDGFGFVAEAFGKGYMNTADENH